MRRLWLCVVIAAVVSCVRVVCGGVREDFPHYRIGGHEREGELLRELYAIHYGDLKQGTATLYDEWLTVPAIWPATGDAGVVRKIYGDLLADSIVTSDGYVASQMHYSVAHPLGWPLPPGFWGDHAAAWHFSFAGEVPAPYRVNDRTTPAAGWSLVGAADGGVRDDGWHVNVTAPQATVATPVPHAGYIDAAQAPYVILIWRGEGLAGARPYVEWTTADHPDFSPERRVEVESPDVGTGERIYNERSKVRFGRAPAGTMVYTPIPLYRHPGWTGAVTRLRVGIGNPAPGGEVTLQAIVTSFDTRHTINNPSFVHACIDYFRWTGDVDFLRRTIGRMRAATRCAREVFHVRDGDCVRVDWVAHDGRSGVAQEADGTTRPISGRGIGSNYWDLLPFGGRDAYATIRYYDMLLQMASIERDVAAHPGWDVPSDVARLDPDELDAQAERVKQTGNRLFWNEKAGRFVACVDADGVAHDFGYTFVNLEAVYYGFATDEHARRVMDWVDGRRVVAGDTSTGADIYHWRFAPRASTVRNTTWYAFWWTHPEQVPWGGQVQDGGAVLGFSYHDLMARLKVNGPDDAAARLAAIADWYADVRAAGGYRKYYDGASHNGALQGGGTAGGLGLDREFHESAMVTTPLLLGFLGFRPTADGFLIDPRLPTDWPDLTIDRIRYRDRTLRIRAARDSIEVHQEIAVGGRVVVGVPQRFGRAVCRSADGAVVRDVAVVNGSAEIDFAGVTDVRFEP